MRILLTGVGCPGAITTINMLMDNPHNVDVCILGVDTNVDAVGKSYCDLFQRVPAAHEPVYVHIMYRLCEINNIDLIIPLTTAETVTLSKYKKMFNKLDVKIFTSDFTIIEQYNNKHKLLNMFKSAGLPHPEFIVSNNYASFLKGCETLGYPEKKVVIKPAVGNGSRGVRIIANECETYIDYLNNKPNGMSTTLENIVNCFQTSSVWPETLITEHLPGIEYTVDVLNTPDHRIIIPRKRNKIVNGISFEIEVVNSRKITDQLNKILDLHPMYGVFGFQFIENINGDPTIIECNPRIQGTMCASLSAGVNIIWLGVQYFLNQKIFIPEIKIDNQKLSRYWNIANIN